MVRIRRFAPPAGTIVALAAAMFLGACQSAPPATLTDPREILAAAVTATAAARTVRIDGSADGTVGLEITGFDSPSAVELDGTTFSADLDLEGGDARATFSAPGLLGLTGEVIAVDGASYLKTTLTGALYRTLSIGAEIPEPSGAVRASILEGLTDLLARPELDPVKAEDVACGNTTCYRVEITLSPADLAALGAGDLEAPTGLPDPDPAAGPHDRDRRPDGPRRPGHHAPRRHHGQHGPRRRWCRGRGSDVLEMGRGGDDQSAAAGPSRSLKPRPAAKAPIRGAT